jgi:hypothetical protein
MRGMTVAIPDEELEAVRRRGFSPISESNPPIAAAKPAKAKTTSPTAPARSNGLLPRLKTWPL